MSFEIQELPDVIGVIILLTLSKGTQMPKPLLRQRIGKLWRGVTCIEESDLDQAIAEMASEGLLTSNDGTIQLTEQGIKLGNDWKSLLLKREPVLEVVSGLTDGSITGLVVILSAYIAGLAPVTATFAAFLTLAAVAITNFSSFLLGGITEDLADMMTLRSLMHYSLSDISDKNERDKSLLMLKQLFTVLRKGISRSNFYAALICSTTTFLAGILPIIVFLSFPSPLDIIMSLGIVGTVVGGFLVRYRSKRTKVHWKITLFETVAIVLIAVIASLVLGGSV